MSKVFNERRSVDILFKELDENNDTKFILELIRFIHENQINTKNDRGYILLIKASAKGYYKIVKQLLTFGRLMSIFKIKMVKRH